MKTPFGDLKIPSWMISEVELPQFQDNPEDFNEPDVNESKTVEEATTVVENVSNEDGLQNSDEAATTKCKMPNLTDVPDVTEVADIIKPPETLQTPTASNIADEAASTHMSEQPHVTALKNPTTRYKIVEVPAAGEVPKLTEMPKVTQPPTESEEPKQHEHSIKSPNAEKALNVSNYEKQIQNLVVQDATTAWYDFNLSSPLVATSFVVLPTYYMYKRWNWKTIRKDGLRQFLKKMPMRSKIMQLLILSTGLAAASYRLNKPDASSRFIKEFKEA